MHVELLDGGTAPRGKLAGAPLLPESASHARSEFRLRRRKEAVSLCLLACDLTRPPNGLRPFAYLSLRRLLIRSPLPQFAEDAFALHFLLQDPHRLIDIVISDHDQQYDFPSFDFPKQGQVPSLTLWLQGASHVCSHGPAPQATGTSHPRSPGFAGDPLPLKANSSQNSLHAPRGCAKTKRPAPLQQNRPSQDVLHGIWSPPYPPTSIFTHGSCVTRRGCFVRPARERGSIAASGASKADRAKSPWVYRCCPLGELHARAHGAWTTIRSVSTDCRRSGCRPAVRPLTAALRHDITVATSGFTFKPKDDVLRTTIGRIKGTP
jgi:hypothetical protein